MSAENDEKPAQNPRRFNSEQARERVQQAQAKAEFILSRAYGLFRAPAAEWEQIRAEKTNIPSILLGYVAPLATIPPLCGLIGVFAFGTHIAGTAIRPDFGDALVSAVVSFVASVALVFLLGLLINALAEQFDADRDDLGAQKVAAYSMTPAFMSGVFSLWPPIWWLSLFAIAYSAFLFYRGLPPLMKAPQERALGYATTVVIAGSVAFIVLFGLASCVAGAGRL